LLAEAVSAFACVLPAGLAAAVFVEAGAAGVCFAEAADVAAGFAFDCAEGLFAGCAGVCAHITLERTTIIELCISFIKTPVIS
jgi:hypothetical protein